MTSLTNIPGEARCKQLVYQLLTKQTGCASCSGALSWRREWCRVCRNKVRPKAATWFRGSKFTYRQVFTLISCFQNRQSPNTARLAVGATYTTVRRWYWRFRVNLPVTMPELSGIVEVDESFFGKQKYGHQTLVVGIIEGAVLDWRGSPKQFHPD